MTDIAVIIGNYGKGWRALPVTAHGERGTVIFADHRTSAASLQASITAAVGPDGFAVVDQYDLGETG